MVKKSFLQPDWEKGNKSERFDQIKDFFVQKEVLDIGCTNGYHRKDWIHRQIVEVAGNTIGLDIEVSRIEEMQAEGFQVMEGNATDFNISKTFDVIHAGELIEHLDNFHGFLSSCHKHLNDDGLLIITTPNALRITNFLYSLTGRLLVNAEHTCWFCETTLSTLLTRNHFTPILIDYLRHSSYSPIRKQLSNMVRILLPDRLAWNTLLIVARKNEVTTAERKV